MIRAVRSSKLLVVSAIALAASALGSPGCEDGYGALRSQAHLLVALEAGDPRVPPAAPNPLSFDTPASFTFKITAIKADGTIDTAFNGFVRLSSKPGSVQAVDGPNTNGRNVKLAAGVADGVRVSLLAAYGPTHVWAEDMGYVPGDPTKTPQCSDGIDNNNNGLIDFPADPGCAFANDDTEDGGSYVAGTSEALYFVAPRISDVRGVTQGGAATAFPHEQVQIDTGWRGENKYEFTTIITRVASDGFYATDLADADKSSGGRGFASVFAYNFSAPPRMRVCDRLKTYGGTSSDFYGFTEVNYPAWTLEEWDPTARNCMVPEPTVLDIGMLNVDVSITPLLNAESSLVRVETVKNPPAKDVEVHVAKRFGPHYPTYTIAPDGTYSFAFTDDATNCDLNRDGTVDYNADPEKSCGNTCTADVDCSEYSNYQTRNGFRLVMVDASGGGTPTMRPILADASTAAQFDPLATRGQTIRSFTGTLRYFSGGKQFTIEARCLDDIVADLSQSPVASDTACVHARTIFDVNAGSN